MGNIQKFDVTVQNFLAEYRDQIITAFNILTRQNTMNGLYNEQIDPRKHRNPLLLCLTRWLQGNRNERQRVETLYHVKMSDRLFLRDDETIDYTQKHHYLDLRDALRGDLLIGRPWEEAVYPMAEFMKFPCDAAWWQTRYQSLHPNPWADFHDFEDHRLIELMDRTRDTTNTEMWQYVIEFVYWGSQSTIIDVNVRERVLSEQTNVAFRPQR